MEVGVKPSPDSSSQHIKGQVHINYYTDPLCCWCWAMENAWNRLLTEYDNDITIRYVLGGMIADWDTYHDPLNVISKPMQMGPVWMHAAQITQTKIDYSIWHTDPPSSSYPSSIAIKCVGLQSEEAECQYMYKVRKAVMTEGRNISKSEVLLTLAEELENELPGFSLSQFIEDKKGSAARDALRKDMEQAAFSKIGRYPTLTMIYNGEGLILTGYRPYAELKKAIEHMLALARASQAHVNTYIKKQNYGS